jgi:uncharacterized protein (TIGR02217 family)
MAFLENLIFPEELALGGSGGPMWFTEVVINAGGHEQRNQRWANARAEYEIGFQNRTLAETQTLFAIAYLTKGKANPFRFKDIVTQDYTGTDEPVGTGTGALATYQVIRRYTLAGYTYDRPVYKLVSGTLVVKSNTVVVVPTAINLNNGTFTLNATLGEAITASFQYHVPVRLNFDATKITRGPEQNTFQWPSVQLIETRDIA